MVLVLPALSWPGAVSDAMKEALASNGPSVIEIPVAEYFPAPAPTPGGAGRI